MLHSTELFAHLQQYRPVSVEAVLRGSRDGSSVHPAVLALGLRYGDGSITGSTARCVALVHALCQVGLSSCHCVFAPRHSDCSFRKGHTNDSRPCWHVSTCRSDQHTTWLLLVDSFW